jgi:DNA-binding NarL/FixJ family response regulator
MRWQVTPYSYLLLVAAAMSATLVLDARMPEMDGLTATRKIKKEMPAISVLVVSAYESEDYRREAASAGATDYISKDAERRQLLEVVHAGLGQRGKG